MVGQMRSDAQKRGTDGRRTNYRQRDEQERMRKELEDRMKRARIPRRYQMATFTEIERRGLPQDARIRHNYSYVRNFANNLQENVKHGYGMTLAGSPGTLKTTMAVAVLRKWIEGGGNGMFVPMPSLINILYTLKNRNREEEQKFIDRVYNVPVLVLDDLGGENFTQDWIAAQVDDIISSRYNEVHSTIITTNFLYEDMKHAYGIRAARILDRLKNTGKYLEFIGKSQREAMR